MSKPLYYLHIPKTGGTSLISFLDGQFDADDICPAQLLPELFSLDRDSLHGYKLFRGHLWHGLDAYIGQKLRYITMLRDPIKRTISWYMHAKRDANAYRHNEIVNDGWSLVDFVEDVETNWDMVNTQTLFLAADLDYEKLSLDPVGYGRIAVKAYAERRNDRALLELAKKRLESFDFFGITERMRDSLSLLSYTLGCYPEFHVPELNASENRASEGISDEAIARISEITSLDRELYDWACDLFEERFASMISTLLVSRYVGSDSNNLLSWCAPIPKEDREDVVVTNVRVPQSVISSAAIQMSVTVKNGSRWTLSSRTPNPIHLSYHWIRASDGQVIVFDGARTQLPRSLAAGDEESLTLNVSTTESPGDYILRVTLVQEGIGWFDDDGRGAFADAQVTVR